MPGISDDQGRLNLLVESARLSSESFGWLRRAEAAKVGKKPKDAASFYEQSIDAQTRVLKHTETLNRAATTPTDVKPIVGTMVNVLFIYADVLESLKRRSEAEEKRKRALKLSTKYLGAAGEAEAERSRAAALILQARFNEALVALYNARDCFLLEGNVLKSARTSVDLADLLQWLGDYTRAVEELDQAAATYSQAEERGGLDALVDFVEKRRIELELSYYRGIIAKYVGEFEKAERLLRHVLPTYEGLGSGPAIEYQIASVMIRSGRLTEGLDMANKIEPVMRQPGLLRPKLAALLNIQAEALIELGQPENAIKKLEQGISDLDEYYDLDLLWRLEWRYAAALRSAEQTQRAVEAYGNAINTVVQLRRAPLGYRLDSTYLSDKIDLFREAISLAAESDMARECAVYMDLIKSRTLSATLSIPREISSATAKKPSDEFESITERLDTIEYTGFRDGWTRGLYDEQKTLLGRRASLLEKLRVADPRWRSLTQPLALDVDALIGELKSRKQAVLSLFNHGDKVSAVLLGDQTERVGTMELSDKVRSKLSEYTGNLQVGDDEPNLLKFDASTRLSLTAEVLVPEALLAEALQFDSLIVVPHGELHLLPWAGLTFQGKRLFEYCAIGVLPSLSCILSLSEEPAETPKIALVGAPDYSGTKGLDTLPSAEHEIKAIEKTYADRGRMVASPLTGKNATESKFWKLARNPQGKSGILHISCHGGSQPDEPMNSGLYLRDGKIDAAEIARTVLPYNEVVLSACSTGWRPSKVADVELVADDILGLPGAFLEAGARSVLVSIPKVPDEAATEFFIRYHEARATGATPLRAYRDAQFDSLANSKRRPAEWVGITLYGCR